MRKACLLLCPALILLLVAGPALAYDTAKSLGMAGAVVAIGDDLSAPYINPAGLATMKKNCAGLSLNSRSVVWSGDAEGNGSRTDLFENLGGAMSVGPGTIYAGLGTVSWFFANLNDPGVGSDVVVDAWLNAPGIAYGMEVMPGLLVGGGLNYLAFSSITDQPDTGDKLTYTGNGVGATLGALYAVGPTLNVGGSITLLGDVIGSGKFEGVVDADIDRANSSFPTTTRIGAAMKPMPDLTVSGQFDVVGGVNFVQTAQTDAGDAILDIRTDSVVVSRIGVEYLAAQGKVPLWAGVSFVPDNNGALEPENSEGEYALFGNAGYVIPNTTTISLGAGYNEGPFNAGIALQSSTGSFTMMDGDVTVAETKILASGGMTF